MESLINIYIYVYILIIPQKKKRKAQPNRNSYLLLRNPNLFTYFENINYHVDLIIERLRIPARQCTFKHLKRIFTAFL